VTALRVVLRDASFGDIIGDFVVRSCTGQVQLSELGRCEIRVPLDDPLIAEVVDGAIVQVLIRPDDAEVDDWRAIYAGQVEKINVVERSPQGGRGREWRISTVSWLNRAAKAKVIPAGGIGPATFDDVRRFDWSAPELETSGWATAPQRTVVGDRDGDPPDGLKGLPETFPNRLAYWLGPSAAGGTEDAAGTMWVDFTYTNPADATNYHYATGDDTFKIARDGVPLYGFTDPMGTAAANTYARGLRETSGDHVMRAEVTNEARPGNPHNAHLFAWACGRREFVSGGFGLELDETWVATTSSSGWRYTTDQADVQFAWGDQFRILVGEVASWMSVSFTATHDSNGAPWERGTFVWSADDSLVDVLRKSADAGWCEFLPDAEGFVLHAFVAQGAGAVKAAVEYEAATTLDGAAVAKLDHTLDWTPIVTKLHVRDAYGWFPVGTGDEVDTLRVPQITDRAEATRLAEQYLARSGEVSVSTAVGVSPPSPEMVPNPDGVWLGDSPTLPLHAGPGVGRLWSISWRSADGHVDWTFEAVSPRRDFLDRLARIARRTSAGSLGGRSEVSSPVSPFQPASTTLAMTSVTWSMSGNAVSQSTGVPVETFPEPTRIMTLELRASGPADPPTSGSSTVTLSVGGTALPTITLPSGQLAATVDVATTIAQKGEALSPSCVAGNHAGLSFKVYGSPLPQ